VSKKIVRRSLLVNSTIIGAEVGLRRRYSVSQLLDGIEEPDARRNIEHNKRFPGGDSFPGDTPGDETEIVHTKGDRIWKTIGRIALILTILAAIAAIIQVLS